MTSKMGAYVENNDVRSATQALTNEDKKRDSRTKSGCWGLILLLVQSFPFARYPDTTKLLAVSLFPPSCVFANTASICVQQLYTLHFTSHCYW